MEMQLGEALHYNDDEGGDDDSGNNGPSTTSSIASSSKVSVSRLPRCAVVNFKKDGDQISVQPRATTDTGM